MIHHVYTALGFLTLALAMALWVIMTLEMKHFVPPSLEEGSTLAKVFARPPAPSYKYIYVFHISNSRDWAQGVAQNAVLKELGPYVFRMETTRNLNWSGEILFFQEQTSFYFEVNMSKGALNDTFTTVNLPAMLSSNSKKSKKSSNKSIFLTTTIEKYFFTGSEDISEQGQWKLATQNQTFAWFANVNASYGEKYMVHTKSGFVNRIIAVNNNTILAGYTSVCSDITGKIAGFGLLPAFTLSPDTVTIYEPRLCVPWTLGLQEQYNFGYEPIARFYGGRSLFNATSKICKSNWQTNTNGTFDASPYYSPDTSRKLPVVLSYPHFLYGEPALHTQIDNLKPSEKKHSFYIDVHAPSGLVVDMKLRSQLNIKFAPSKSMRPVILPLFWQEISRLPGGKEKMVAAVTVWPVFAGWVAFACSISLLAAGLCIGAGIILQGPVKCWEFEEEKIPNTPDDIPTDELSSEPEEDLRREQRRRALRARLPAGLPVYFKIHKGDLDDLGVTIPEWVLAKIQQQIDEQSSSSSCENSSDELSSAAGSTSWSTVSSRSTSPDQKIQKSEPASDPLRSRSCGQEKTLTSDQGEKDRSQGSCPPEDFEEEVQEEEESA